MSMVLDSVNVQKVPGRTKPSQGGVDQPVPELGALHGWVVGFREEPMKHECGQR